MRRSGQPHFLPCTYTIYVTAAGGVKVFVYGPMASDSTTNAIALLVQQVFREVPFSMRQIAAEAGVSYDAVRSWATDRRTPRAESLIQLADAIERRSENMREVASELRRAAGQRTV